MKPAYERLILIIFISLVLTLVGCRTKDDDGESPTPGGAATATEPTAAATGLTFNISGATALIAQEDTMTEASASSSAFASGGGEVKRYRIVNQRREREALREAKATGDLPNFASTENDPSSGTNLFAVDENGNSQLALSADNAIKVMYSVVDPNGEYVYLALDAGWNEDDGNDYTQHIALANCAFYKVKIADDSYSCVMEGATVQPMDDSYAMTVSGNQKPVQFDSQGNLFFAATTFEREEYATGEVVSYSVSATQWDPQIYKMDQETGEISTVTQDNVTVDFFMVLTTGELVYQSTNIETEQSKLYLYQGSSTIDLTGAGWGVDFFARDDTNAVLWGSFTQTGIRFARPRSEGGVYKATMDTNLFGGAGGGDSSYNSRPVRILVGDNGRIYGVFQSWVMQNQGTRPQNPMDDSVDAGTTDSNLSVSFLPKLTVYQILPFDGTPKLELTMPEDGDWWTWMGNTPFQVANGYLFYKELYDSADYYGTKDVIRLIELEDRTETVLLDEVDQRYEIYNWRLTGNTLYFSALDKVDTKVVVGAVDTGKITADASSDDYLTITQTDSASGTISAVQDMELLVPEAVEEDTGVTPSVLKIHAKSENLYSLSVDFNKNMDRESVEEAVSLIDTSNETTLLDTLKIWVKHTLHLIPDLDETGTADSTSTTPLLVNSEYKLELGDGVLDHWGTSLEADTQKTRIFKTRPASGWYMTDTDAGEPTISDGNVAKYAMEDTDTASDPYQTDSKVYAVATGIPADFRLEFSAINYGTGGINLFLIDTTPVDLWGELTPKTFYEWPWSVEEEHHIQLRLGKWSELLYCTNYEDFWWDSSWGCWSDWTLQETPALFNGNWQRYQVDVYGSTVDVFYKNTEGNPVKIHGLSREDLMSRAAGHNFNLYIGVIQPVGIDNLRIYPLSEAGVEETVYKLTDKSLETLEKTIPAADWSEITGSGNDIRDLKNKSYSTETAFKNALSGKITGGMYTAHENEIMEALENHDYVLNLDFDGNGGKELFQALFDPLLEVDDGSVLQDVIGGSSLSGNEGTKFSGIMLTTETESFQHGVGSQGTSYYTFELDWADTGEYQITLASAEDLSNITISHYEGEAVRDNLQSSCSLGENPCTIEVYWSWPAPMIAVQNDGAAITDFSILVAKVGGAHLSEGTFDVGILLDLEVMHDGQVGFADDPEDYFSYYEVNNLGQSGELTVSITDVVGGIPDDLLIEYYEDGMYVDECDQGELTCSITISSSWVLPMVTVVNMGFDQTNYGITVGTGGGSGGTTGGLPLSGSITDLEPGEFQYHETNFIVPAGDGSGFYLHISDATGNALIQPAVECYYEDEWWNYTWENCTDSLFGDGSCNLDYLWEGEECRVGFYNEDLIESIGFDFEINTIP